jgi:hypothetical protein
MQIKLLTLISVLFIATFAKAAATVVLENHRKTEVVTLYIDGNFGCGAVSKSYCTTLAVEGKHTLKFFSSPRGDTDEKVVTLEDGESYTWVVCDVNDKSPACTETH